MILIFPLASWTVSATSITWNEIQKTKKGKITVHFRENAPFLIENSKALLGLEYEIIEGFQYFLAEKYDIQLAIQWKEKNSFREIYHFIKDDASYGDFGLGIISKTSQRAKEVSFSDPYFPDIQVLISHRSTSIVSTKEEFKETFADLKAITTLETTYDINLQKIQKELSLDFAIQYIRNSSDIISNILKSDDHFGYVDLPNYLIALDKDLPVIRHNLYPVKGVGYCLIFSNSSDWVIPFNEYLSSEGFKKIQRKSVEKYLGMDVNELIRSITQGEDEELIVLKQEKKLINEVLAEKAEEVELQNHIRNILIVTIILAFVVAFFLYNRNRIKTTANEVLTLHRKMIESQNKLLSKRNEELIDLNEEKNNFIQILSHDLRAPINNINGLAQILLMDGEKVLTEDQLRVINHISTESRRLTKMVTRILDVERIESKNSEEFRAIDVAKVVENVIGNYEQQANEKNIKIETKLKKNAFIMGLEQFLFHVVENLLSNAIKFTPIGKSVFIELQTQGEGVQIDVRDQGPGMSEEDIKNMFKKFQVLTAKATGGERSTGLGLSIVQKYTNLLDGQLNCSTELGEGTTFSARFNRIKDTAKIKVKG